LASVKPIAYFDRYQIDYRRAPAGRDDSLLFASPSVGSDVAITLTNFSSADLYLLDVTQPLQPVRLTGSTPTADGLAFVDDLTTEGKGYLAASQALSPVSVEAYHATVDLLQPAEGADVIAIAPEAFFTALQPWVDRREAQGYRVRVVDVEDTYALFNGGVLHPEAIRSFVAYAHANWPAPAPEYLVLVGDGHFNFKGFNPATYGDFLPVHIPPYLDFLDPDQGEVPVDSYYADLDGDGLADFAVGRFPVQTVSQLEGVVGKILAYEDRESGPWMRNLLFVADDGYNNSEPGFAAALDNLAATYASPLLSMDKVYIKDYCSPVSVNPCIAATLALTQSWGQGPALLTYSGHGSINRWGHEPLLWNVDVATLEPMEGLPFIISLDCWDGYWMFP
ncbi:MAG: C25 family cysteine peptidase, partial [Anaerolineae bacterium]